MRQRLAVGRRMDETNVTQNLGCLFLEFLSLYGSAFNYQDVGVTILDGGKYFSKRNMGPEWNNPSRFELSILSKLLKHCLSSLYDKLY